MKKYLFFVFMILSALVVKAQFTYQGVFPPPELNNGVIAKYSLQGLAVDPDGKVWISYYHTLDSLFSVGGEKVFVSAIYVYNADGTPASFSPIKFLGTDTLKGRGRGLGTDKDGNILHSKSGPNSLFK